MQRLTDEIIFPLNAYFVHIETISVSRLQGGGGGWNRKERQIQLCNHVILTHFLRAKTVSSTICGVGLFEGCNNGAPSLFIFGLPVFFFVLPPPLVLCLFSEQLVFYESCGLWMVKPGRQSQRSVFCLLYDSRRCKQQKEHL